MNKTPAKSAKTPRKLNERLWSTRNKQLQGQRRQVLGKHYAAKYRVR